MAADVFWEASIEMTSTETPEPMAYDQNDFDSSSSSSDDRNARKRFGGELEPAGLKKRRKQSTPLKFSTPSMPKDGNASEEESEDFEALEGKSLKKFLHPASAAKNKADESDLCCQFCGRLFDNKPSLSQHMDCEHSVEESKTEQSGSSKPQLDNFVNPVNLSTIAVKNFASMMSRFEPDQSLVSQNNEWSSRLPIRDHVQGLPPMPAALSQYLHFPGFPLTDASPLSRSLGSTPPRIFNRDAYCDLCNKEFCNKYFLKTHKANKHGIYSDTSSQGASSDTPLSSSTFPESFPKMDTPHAQVDNNFMTNLTSSDTSQKIIKTEDNAFDNGEHLQQSPLEMLFKQEYSEEDPKVVPEPSFNIDRLRRLGVVNLEAFCEICCKEFCSKYFLRVHKMKRHGIFVHENQVSAKGEIQTSPLNLIVTEAGNESGYRSEDEQECKPCGIRFQTEDLFLTHRQKLHDSALLKTLQNDESAKPDTISEDLQKLQTMILQLNGLESKNTTCHLCCRDFESLIALQAHMSSDHDIVPEDRTTPTREMDKSPVAHFCTLCEKDYLNQESLRKHIAEEHTPNSILPQNVSTPTTKTTLPPKTLTSMTPTSSFCEICNKELCNKYFMKTHMHRMHGIEISNGAQIGGVICNICNKELCSKYFLRVHKHNTHGIVEDGAPVPVKQDSFDASNSEDSTFKPETADLNNRYITHFTEVCPICNRRFRSVKWLKAHLLSDHGKLGVDKWKEYEEQYPISRIGNRTSTPRSTQSSPGLKIPNGQETTNQPPKTGDYPTLGTQVLSNLFGSDEQCAKTYRCSFCNFTTIALPFLFLHEKSHLQDNNSPTEGNSSLQCPICSQVFAKPEMLHHHLLTSHQFPSMVSQFNSPMMGHLKLEKEKTEAKFQVLGESKDQKMDTTVQVTPQGAYKCSQCGFATTNLNRIKKHVKKDHKSMGDATDSVIAELTRALKEVANKRKVPATYAMPQDMNSNPDKSIMQPFLMEEFQGNDEKRFAPALVYLPVKTRVNGALTASFTLSPA